MEIKEIIELMQAVSENALTSFELERGDMKLSMKREKKLVAAGRGAEILQTEVPQFELRTEGAAVTVQSQEAGGVPQAGHAAIIGEVASDKVVKCPLVGTFYSSAAPDTDDFVKVGDSVKKGQVIGIVEAMKLMNEIECEYDGIVDAVLVKNEEVVEYGQPLFRIR